ncbi:MAG: prepilin-type N-terminal cleavage/methylation domain-containing protein [Thiohalomonadaceae bacterium]
MTRQHGFSLLELAVVLVILGLLLGGLLTPLGTSMEHRRVVVTDTNLALAQEALLGFALVHGRLPCADQDGDGNEDCPLNGEGALPWQTLGLTRTRGYDAWGNALRYRPDGAFTGVALADPPHTTDGLRVQEADGTPLTAGNPNAPVAVVLALGPDHLGNGENGTADTVFTDTAWCTSGCTVHFDDRLVVLGRNVLIARLAAAGRWP